ncbi:MAG: hypothetical protein AB8G15_03475 [Saprospiraceae bacterium]
MKKVCFFSLLLLLLVVSCKDQALGDLEVSGIHPNKNMKGVLVEGRLHFDSESDFESSIEYLKSLEDEAATNLMYEFYGNGFQPLYPFYRENDEQNILAFVAKKTKRNEAGQALLRNTPTLEIDDDPSEIEPDDDLIGDDYFAALLNFDREIVVSGKLHKYTHEGVFRVDLAKKSDLDAYVVQHNITELNQPDPSTITRGLVQLTPTVERFAPDYISGGCGPQTYLDNSFMQADDTYDAFYNDFMEGGCGSTGGGGSGGSSGGSSSTPDHTNSMKNYMKNLAACDTQNGGIFGWNPFGTSKKCFSYHSSKYRVKTKYWNENLLFYSSIGVKVKHQKKRWWWGTKTTDEVALVINQAMFAITYPNQIPNYNALPTYSSNNSRMYYYDGKFYDNFAASYLVATGWTPTNDALVPKTPFTEDIIIQEYIDLPILRNIDDIEIEAKEINKMFWEEGVWNGAKSLMNRFGQEPVRVTYIVTTPQKVYVNYVDLTQRRLNTKKIVNTLDYDWGGEIKFTWSINSAGNWTSNINDWGNPLSYAEAFDFTDLTDFDILSMDFVGMTRRGNAWKGSRIVYQKN